MTSSKNPTHFSRGSVKRDKDSGLKHTIKNLGKITKAVRENCENKMKQPKEVTVSYECHINKHKQCSGLAELYDHSKVLCNCKCHSPKVDDCCRDAGSKLPNTLCNHKCHWVFEEKEGDESSRLDSVNKNNTSPSSFEEEFPLVEQKLKECFNYCDDHFEMQKIIKECCLDKSIVSRDYTKNSDVQKMFDNDEVINNWLEEKTIDFKHRVKKSIKDMCKCANCKSKREDLCTIGIKKIQLLKELKI